MARNETFVNASPEAVWDVLCDPYAYPEWVVGTDRTLEADADWPLPESKFKVRIALNYSDYTHSRAIEPQRRIVLDAAGGPLGAARIVLTLKPEAGGTRVTIVEDPAGPMRPLHWFPPMHLLLRLRNVESMRRFKRLVEARARRNQAAVHAAPTV